jgi:hypothetical protein
MEDVIRELELIGWLLKGLFGEMFSDVVQFEEPEPSRFPDDDAVQILCGEDKVLSDDCFNDDEAEETGTFYSPVDCSPAFIDQQSDPFGYEEQLKVNFAAQDEASLPASRMSSPALATLSHSNEEWRSLVTPNSVSSSPARGTTSLCPTPPRRSNSFHERWRQSGLWMK